MFDFEGEVFEIVEAVGDAFDDFDLVVDALQLAGVYLMLAVADDSVLMPLEHLGELHQGGMAVLPGNLAPLSEHLHGPAGVVIIPDVGQQILEPIDERRTRPPVVAYV